MTVKNDKFTIVDINNQSSIPTKKPSITWETALFEIPKKLFQENPKTLFKAIRVLLEYGTDFSRYIKVLPPEIFWIGRFVRKIKKGADIFIFPELFSSTCGLAHDLYKQPKTILGNIDKRIEKVQNKLLNRKKSYIPRYSKFCNKERCQIKIDIRIKALIALGSSALFFISSITNSLKFFAGANFFLTSHLPIIFLVSSFFLLIFSVFELSKTSTKLSKLSKKIIRANQDEKDALKISNNNDQIKKAKASKTLYYQKVRTYSLYLLEALSLLSFGILGLLSYMTGLRLSLLFAITAVVNIILSVLRRRSNSVTKKMKDQYKNAEKDSIKYISNRLIEKITGKNEKKKIPYTITISTENNPKNITTIKVNC